MSLRDIASDLPSANQASSPPHRISMAPPTSPLPSASHATPPGSTNPPQEGKGKERAPPVPPQPQPPPPDTVWPSPSADPDFPRYETSTSPPPAYNNPKAFAKKYPHTWEAEEFQKWKYPPSSKWIPGYLDLSWRSPITIALWAASTYAQAADPPLPTKGQKRPQAKPSVLASSVPVASREAFMKPPPPFPKLYAGSLPQEPPSNPIRKQPRSQPTSRT